MNSYLITKGYLFPKVTYSYSYTKQNRRGSINHPTRKKVRVKYEVETGPLYIIDSVFFPTDTSKLNLIVSSSHYQTLLKKDNAFDADEMAKEQLRIHHEFQNQGYFFFRKDF